jgi:hypothetical protein
VPSFLVDTSLWIEFFRAPRRVDIPAIVDFDEVATCLPVVQEVLQGIREEAHYRKARLGLLNMPLIEVPLGLDVVEDAVALYRTARRNALTIRSSADCLIAACALRHDLEVLHRDRDYPLIARISRLRERSL